MMLLRYLKALGAGRSAHLVVSMMPPGPVAEQIGRLGVDVHSLGVRSFIDLPKGVLRLRRLLDVFRPQVVHGWMYHGCFVASLALRLARRSEIGLVWGIHHSLSDERHEKVTTRAVLRALRRLTDHADVITYCSQQSRDQHTAFGFPARRGRFVPNAIDTLEFAPDPSARQRLHEAGVPAGRQIIGTVARAHPMKDHAAFAAVIAQLAAEGRDVHGVLIGEGQPDGPAVKAALAKGISDRITALPSRLDISRLVPGFDLYLSTSAWGEALPLAVAEGMAAGVPAVVTDVGDCAWLVDGSGAVCPTRSSELLRRAAAEILDLPPAERRDLGLRARARIARVMSVPEYVARHSDIHAEARARRNLGQRMGDAA